MIIKRKLLASAFLSLLFFWISSCSSAWNHPLHQVKPKAIAIGKGNVLVLVHDHRSEVLSGGQKSSIVGEVRSLYGDPWQIRTASGKPLAQDVGTAMCNALMERGFGCQAEPATSRFPEEEIKKLIEKHAPFRVIKAVISQWESDTYVKTSLKYAISANIYDPNLFSLGYVNLKGEDQLTGNVFTNPAKNASVLVPRALKGILESILNQDKMVAALSTVQRNEALGASY